MFSHDIKLIQKESVHEKKIPCPIFFGALFRKPLKTLIQWISGGYQALNIDRFPLKSKPNRFEWQKLKDHFGTVQISR